MEQMGGDATARQGLQEGDCQKGHHGAHGSIGEELGHDGGNDANHAWMATGVRKS